MNAPSKQTYESEELASPTIVHCHPDGTSHRWFPTTIDRLKKSEEFLEDVLVNSPDLMGLQSRRSGVHGPFRVFRQVSMQTPSGRCIYPDIVIFSSSGHVIVIEVKRYVNPELKDRAVIAQIIDYASSFASLTQQKCAELFGAGESSTWYDCVDAMFPNDQSTNELAEVLWNRMRQGEINLVIACDRIPAGLPEIVAGIANQNAFGFTLELAEIAPYVREESEDSEILFVPSLRMSTEIVSRTAVTVNYKACDTVPSASVRTTSVETIQANLKSAALSGNSNTRIWTEDEVEMELQQIGPPIAMRLFQFAKQHSIGPCVARGRTQNAVFGFYVERANDSTAERELIFNCVVGWGGITFYLAPSQPNDPSEPKQKLRDQLKQVFGDEFNADLQLPGVLYNAIEPHFGELQEVLLRFQAGARSVI